MIKIEAVTSDNVTRPVRPLTEEELVKTNGMPVLRTETEYIYFQPGDEDTPEWEQYEQILDLENLNPKP